MGELPACKWCMTLHRLTSSPADRKLAVAQGSGHLPGLQYWTQEQYLKLTPDASEA